MGRRSVCTHEQAKDLVRVDASRWGQESRGSDERQFLSGPQPRGFEFIRACPIFFELLRGFRAYSISWGRA